MTGRGGALLAAAGLRCRRMAAAGVAAALLAASVPAVQPTIASASGVTLFDQPFNNNTVNAAYPVSAPALPGGGTNAACLSASGNTSTGVLNSCTASTDLPGSGKLRLTNVSGFVEGGVFAAASVPTAH